LKRHGRKIEDHEVCCAYHAHFLDSDDDAKLERIVHTPMSEYAAAGVEAARKPPDPTAYKGYEKREAAQRAFGFETYYPGRVVMGGPQQAIERIHALKEAGITQVGLLADFGSLPQDEIMRSLRVFADKVLPHVRDL
jgi:alkanesulfonate monooxygenase SsuD/methylene tetrahydromethanopterin reductase-like flavin-dependent oxidoreductase (luciferase family)